MKKLPFKKSQPSTIGVELEIQLINPHDYDLISSAKELIRSISLSAFQERIKPEITQSMIEINSSIHTNVFSLEKELLEIQVFLKTVGFLLNIEYAGGGTHPFQKWSLRKIFPTKRFKNLARQFRYLSKQATVFGGHIHIGCKDAEDALYLTHALARYVPHLIAISASSPFYQGVDTGYDSTRPNLFNVYPFSGFIPYLTDWQAFSQYFYEMRKLGVIHTMKDVYWDIRPKPEFGTVEIRVCDMPLTIKQAVCLTAYAQALSLYLLDTKPFKASQKLYYLYTYNRFQAIRYGFGGICIDAETGDHCNIDEDILATLSKLQPYGEKLDSLPYLESLKTQVLKKRNDALILRQKLKQVGSFPKLVHEQCKIWENNSLER